MNVVMILIVLWGLIINSRISPAAQFQNVWERKMLVMAAINLFLHNSYIIGIATTRMLRYGLTAYRTILVTITGCQATIRN